MKITLCGSAKFEELYHKMNELLTLQEHTVYSLAVFPSVKGKKDWYTDAQIASTVASLGICNFF